VDMLDDIRGHSIVFLFIDVSFVLYNYVMLTVLFVFHFSWMVTLEALFLFLFGGVEVRRDIEELGFDDENFDI